MAVREVIRIDEEKCDGCGICTQACAEGAIALVDGKAKLVSEVYCDGLGACLGECPRGAITMEKREAPDFDEAAVKARLSAAQPHGQGHSHGGDDLPCGCPGSAMRTFGDGARSAAPASRGPAVSRLSQWPVQLMLVPPAAPFLKGREIVLCADCVPFAVPDFHERYLANRAVLVGCPKLDDLAYYEDKLKAVIQSADPYRLTVVRMEVPCCGGLAHAAVRARDAVKPGLPVEIHTISIEDGSASVELAPSRAQGKAA